MTVHIKLRVTPVIAVVTCEHATGVYSSGQYLYVWDYEPTTGEPVLVPRKWPLSTVAEFWSEE